MKQTFKTTDEIIKHAQSLLGEKELYYTHNNLQLSFVPISIHIIPKTVSSSYVVDKYNLKHDFCVAVASECPSSGSRNIVPADSIYKKRKPLECYVYVGSGDGSMEDRLMVVDKPKNENYRLFREVIEE